MIIQVSGVTHDTAAMSRISSSEDSELTIYMDQNCIVYVGAHGKFHKALTPEIQRLSERLQLPSLRKAIR